MNLKDINIESFNQQIDEEVKRRMSSFEHELRQRADEMKRAAEDIVAAAKEGVLDLKGQVLDPNAVVFTTTLPKHENYHYSGGERNIYLDYGLGGTVCLGRVQDVAKLFGARLVLTIIPAKTEVKP